MRIVHCIYALRVGGAESLLVDLANEQSRNNSVDLVIVNDVCDESMLSRIMPTVHVHKIGRKPNSRSIIPVIRLNCLLLTLSPHVVHCHNASLVRFLFPSFRCVLTVHGMDISCRYLRHYRRIFAVSQTVGDVLAAKGKYPVTVIPNGIMVESVKRREKQEETLVLFKIVHVGRLSHEEKGQDILIEAIGRLKQRGFLFDVDFIGEGPSLPFLEDLARKLGLSSQIHFLGKQSRDYIYSHLCDYSLFCLPSRKEAFGLVVAEAMAAKIPVLVSAGGGAFEVIEYGRFGYSFDSENIEDCAGKILWIYEHYAEVCAKVESAFLYVEKEYSLQRTVSEYLSFYDKVR